MKNTREQILNKLRNSVLHKIEMPYPELKDSNDLFKDQDENVFNTLKTELDCIGTKCIELNNLDSFIDWFELESKEKEWNQMFCSEPELLGLFSKKNISISEEEKFHEKSVSITFCEALVARTGSIIISSDKPKSRTHSIAADIHIVIAFKNQIMYDLSGYLNTIDQSKNLPSLLTIISGPSRTADIEKTLVMGAHGPKELYVAFIG